MSGRALSWVAWSVCGLTLAMIACTPVLYVLNRWGVVDVPYFLVAEATAALVGALIAARQPRNPVGWIVLGHALCFALGEFARQYALYGLLTEPGSLPLAGAMASPPYWVWYPGIILMFVLLPLYFPDGRLVSPRWRIVAWLAVVVGVIETAIAVVRPGDEETPGIPNPLGVEIPGGALGDVLPMLWLGLGAISAVSLVARFRRSRGEERQQIKWVVYAVVLLISYSLVDQLLLEPLLSTVTDLVLFMVVFEGLWIAIAVAIFRYRLYDIDLLINRTLVYATLTGALGLLYLGGVALLQALFRALTGQEEQSQLAVVASTLTIAALFNPLRRRIQGLIDRGFYRRKYNARETLEAFSAKLRDETDLDALSEDLVVVVRETMQPEHATLWLRSRSADRRATG